MENRRERLEKWASELTKEQLITIIAGLADFAIDAEMVSFWDDALAPFWSNSGEPLVEGQKIYPEDS